MPSDKKEKKRKKERGSRDERRDRDRGDRKDKPKSSALEPADGGILAILRRCCVDVYPCCAKAERIDADVDLRRAKRREREKREERRERRRRKDEAEKGGQESAYSKKAPPQSDDEGSDRSYASRADTECSRASSYGGESTRSRGGASTRSRGGESTRSRGVESTRSRGGESSRNIRNDRGKGCESGRSTSSPERDRRKSDASTRPVPPPKPAPTPLAECGGGAGGIKVLNLADLRGQELPADLVQAGGKQVSGSKGAADDDAQSEAGQSERSARSAAQSEGGQSIKSCASVSVRKYMGYLSEPKSPAEVKKLVKDFVRQMVKGRDLGVLCADGALKPVVCSISRKLDTFKIKSGDQTRRVPLSSVENILHGNPEELNDLQTPLDDACSTMEIENGDCISFKFAERKAAELFTLCMQLFVDGQKS